MAEIDRDVAGYPATVIKPPPPDRELLSCLELIFGWLLLLEQAWLARIDRDQALDADTIQAWLMAATRRVPRFFVHLSLSISKWREVNHPISQRERIFLTFQGICMTISVRQSELWKGENKSKSMDGIKLVIIFDSREFKKSRDFP